MFCLLPYYGRSGDRIPVGERSSAPVKTDPRAHPASCTMGTGSFPGVNSGRDVKVTPHPLLVPWSRKGRTIPLPPHVPHELYRASLPVQGCTLTYHIMAMKGTSTFSQFCVFLSPSIWWQSLRLPRGSVTGQTYEIILYIMFIYSYIWQGFLCSVSYFASKLPSTTGY
jgi:hypothetical protein